MGPLPPPPATEDVKGLTRMTFFSEGYFKMLEPHLGYTGPYVLLWGGLAAAFSKEWLVYCPEIMWMASGMIFYSYVINRGAAPFFDRENTVIHAERHDRISSWTNYKLGLAESEIDGIARLKEQTTGLAMVQEQRKINLQLAIDAEHMNRQADLTDAVKKRLDYQVAVNNAERDAMTKHMISWIDKEVKSAIAKRSTKDDLTAAIAQLKAMAT